MATPHVSGVVATLLEKHNFDKKAALKDLMSSVAQEKLVGRIGDESNNKLLQISNASPSETASFGGNIMNNKKEVAETKSTADALFIAAIVTMGFAALVLIAAVVTFRRVRSNASAASTDLTV